MSINIKLAWGSSFDGVPIDDFNVSVSSLKRSLHQVISVHPSEQRLIFKGRELNDDDHLRAVGLGDGSNLYVATNRSGGGRRRASPCVGGLACDDMMRPPTAAAATALGPSHLVAAIPMGTDIVSAIIGECQRSFHVSEDPVDDATVTSHHHRRTGAATTRKAQEAAVRWKTFLSRDDVSASLMTFGEEWARFAVTIGVAYHPLYAELVACRIDKLRPIKPFRDALLSALVPFKMLPADSVEAACAALPTLSPEEACRVRKMVVVVLLRHCGFCTSTSVTDAVFRTLKELKLLTEAKFEATAAGQAASAAPGPASCWTDPIIPDTLRGRLANFVDFAQQWQLYRIPRAQRTKEMKLYENDFLDVNGEHLHRDGIFDGKAFLEDQQNSLHLRSERGALGTAFIPLVASFLNSGAPLAATGPGTSGRCQEQRPDINLPSLCVIMFRAASLCYNCSDAPAANHMMLDGRGLERSHELRVGWCVDCCEYDEVRRRRSSNELPRDLSPCTWIRFAVATPLQHHRALRRIGGFHLRAHNICKVGQLAPFVKNVRALTVDANIRSDFTSPVWNIPEVTSLMKITSLRIFKPCVDPLGQLTEPLRDTFAHRVHTLIGFRLTTQFVSCFPVLKTVVEGSLDVTPEETSNPQ